MINASTDFHPQVGEVLLINKDRAYCKQFSNNAAKYGFMVKAADSLDSLEDLVCNHKISAVLVDSELDKQQNFNFIKTLININPTTRIYALVADTSLDLALMCMEEGASILPSSMGPKAIAKRIQSEICDSNVLPLPQPEFDYPYLIGKSPCFLQIIDKIKQMKDVNASVLITGDSGTGKELVARALHETSKRAHERFEAINCAAIPENLLESELFGHKRGAFTDAKIEKKGLFELCSEGSILLDEIGEMPLTLQVKLLRVLQEKEIRPVGSTKSIKVNSRVIAITNRNLAEEVEKGNFRLDLYYRLSVLKIHIPPLRERKEDIPILVKKFLERFSHEYNKPIKPVTISQLARIKSYDWPGNVRQLQNALERAVILSKDGRINLDDLFEDNSEPIRKTSKDLNEPFEDQSLPVNFGKSKKIFESRYLTNLLTVTKGNVSEAARLAGKTRVEIYRFLNRNKIKPSNFRK